MTMIVPFKVEHAMELRGHTVEDISSLTEDTALSWKNSGISASAYVGGVLMGCAGVFQVHPGVGQAWLLIRAGQEHKNNITVCRIIKEYLEKEMEKFHRIQAIVNCDLEVANYYIKVLGFMCEGRLHKYGPDGSDYYMYARTE